jgi:hypothetical protein
MTIIVEVKNEILGDSEFWRGDESRIAEIHNIPARMTAEQVVADGKPRVSGMWHVRQELPPNARSARVNLACAGIRRGSLRRGTGGR